MRKYKQQGTKEDPISLDDLDDDFFGTQPELEEKSDQISEQEDLARKNFDLSELHGPRYVSLQWNLVLDTQTSTILKQFSPSAENRDYRWHKEFFTNEAETGLVPKVISMHPYGMEMEYLEDFVTLKEFSKEHGGDKEIMTNMWRNMNDALKKLRHWYHDLANVKNTLVGPNQEIRFIDAGRAIQMDPEVRMPEFLTRSENLKGKKFAKGLH